MRVKDEQSHEMLNSSIKKNFSSRCSLLMKRVSKNEEKENVIKAADKRQVKSNRKQVTCRV